MKQGHPPLHALTNVEYGSYLRISRATTSTIPVIPYPRGRRHGTAALRHGSRNDVTLPEHRRFLVKLVNLGGHLNNAAAAGGPCYPVPRGTK